MGKGDKAGFFQDVEDRDPILAGRFHTDFETGIFSKPSGQFVQPIGKGREAGLLILGTAIRIRDTDTGINPGFMDIKAATVFTKDFK